MIEHLSNTTIPALLVSLGIVLPATSRAFLPAFLASVYLMLIASLGGDTQLEVVAEVAAQENWWLGTAPACAVLGVLALVDFFATKRREIEEMLRLLDPFVKPLMAGITAYGLTRGVSGAHGVAAASDHAIEIGGPLLAAGLVFVTVILRAELLEWIDDLDLDGLSRAVAWLEDAWVLVVMVLFFVLPPLMLLVSAVTLTGVALLERWLEGRAKATRKPCSNCGAPVWPHGLNCPRCQASNDAPCDVAFLGIPLARAAGERTSHQAKLLLNGRCPRCAASLMRRVGTQQCSDCGNLVFATEASIEAYAALTIGRREKHILAITFVLGLIPLIGAIPAVVLYRIQLVAPYRRYISGWQTLGLRTIARITSLLLLMMQWVPIVGWISLPLMALVNHRLHRMAFIRSARSQAQARRTESATQTGVVGAQRGAALRQLARAARPIAVPAFTVLGVLVATGALFGRNASAEVTVHCPADADLILGVWRERFTPLALYHPLLVERFEPDGTYWLEETAGTYRIERGRIHLEVAGVAREYAVWATDDALVYRSASGRISRYSREGAPPIRPSSCSAPEARFIGSWQSSVSGSAMTVAAGGAVAHPAWSGRSSAAAIFDSSPAPTEGWLAVNDADEMLLIAPGREEVLTRLAASRSSGAAVATAPVAAPIPSAPFVPPSSAAAAAVPTALPLVATPPPQPICRVTVDDPTSPLNVRASPSQRDEVLGALPHGAVLTIAERRGPWLRISAPLAGWVWRERTRDECDGAGPDTLP